MIDPMVVEGLVAAGGRRRGSALNRLTPREREVLGHMAQGWSNAAIAAGLALALLVFAAGFTRLVARRAPDGLAVPAMRLSFAGRSAACFSVSGSSTPSLAAPRAASTRASTRIPTSRSWPSSSARCSTRPGGG